MKVLFLAFMFLCLVLAAFTQPYTKDDIQKKYKEVEIVQIKILRTQELLEQLKLQKANLLGQMITMNEANEKEKAKEKVKEDKT